MGLQVGNQRVRIGTAASATEARRFNPHLQATPRPAMQNWFHGNASDLLAETLNDGAKGQGDYIGKTHLPFGELG